MSSFVALLIGLLLHKSAEAFALGVIFVRMGLRRHEWLPQLLVFACVSPVGVFIIMIISQMGVGVEMTYSFIGSFTAGALLYVGILGVVVEEFSEERRVVVKFLLLLGGLLGMGAVNSVTNMWLGN